MSSRTILSLSCLVWMGTGLLVGWLVGCQSLAMPKGSERWPVQWNSKLHVTSRAEVPHRLADPWSEPLPVSRPADKAKAVMNNCVTYFDLTRQGYQATPVRDQQREGAICHALQALQQAVPAQRSFLPGPPFTEHIADVLPPEAGLIISEDDRRRLTDAKSKGLSLAEADPIHRIRIQTGEKVLIEGPDWGIRLEFYARGDFNGDGVEDLLVKTTGWLTEGSYQVIRLLLLTQLTEKGILKLIREYPLS